MGWRGGAAGIDTVACGGLCWVSKTAYEEIFAPMTRSDPSSPGAVVWADAQRLDPSVDLAGAYGDGWTPPQDFRIYFGANVDVHSGLPGPLKLPSVARQRTV